MGYSSLLVASIVIGCVLVSAPVEGARLPRFLCDIYRNAFLDFRCVGQSRPNLFCLIFADLLTETRLGEPACDYFPCTGYGRTAGTQCLAPAECATTESNGICNSGEVCCARRVTPATPAPSPGGGDSSDSSDDDDLAPDVMDSGF